MNARSPAILPPSLPDDYIRIGISRGAPRNIGGGFKIYRKLQPGIWFNSIPDPAEWEARCHAEVLDKLDPLKVRDDLLRLAGGRIPVLCCFERTGDPVWCHRSLAAQWLSEALGQPVPEHGYEHLAQDGHPMLPLERLL